MVIGLDAHAAEKPGEGNATYIRNLLLSLVAQQKEEKFVFYAIQRRHPFYRKFCPSPSLQIRSLRIKNPYFRLPIALALASFRDKLDLLHVQYISPPWHQGRLIATIHDLGFLHHPQTFSRFDVWRLRFLVGLTVRRAKRIITGSIYSQRDIINRYHLLPEKVKVIPYGVSPHFFVQVEPEIREKILDKYGLRRPYFLCVGRLNPRKNLMALIKAFIIFRKKTRQPFQLVIVGKEDFRSQELWRWVKETGEQEIILTGFVPEEDLPAIYQTAELFIYPSIFEGFGLPVLEAMASGVPVITSRRDSLEEIAGDAALLVEPEKVEEIAEAIYFLSHHQEKREELIQRGLNQAAKFSWARAASQTLALYHEVLAGL